MSKLGYLPSTTVAIRVDREGTRRFYSRRLRTTQITFALILTFVLAIGPTSEWAAGDADSYRLSSIGVMLVGLTVSWRLLRRGLLIDRDRLVIRNLLRFRSVPLDHVVEFRSSRSYWLSLRPGLQISLVSGRKRYANAFSNTPADGNPAGTREATELNSYLDGRRTGQPREEHLVPEWQITGNVWAYRAWLLVPTSLLLGILVLLVATAVDPAAVDNNEGASSGVVANVPKKP